MRERGKIMFSFLHLIQLWTSFWKYIKVFPINMDVAVINLCKFPPCTFSPLWGRTSIRLVTMHCNVMRKKGKEWVKEGRLSEYQSFPFGLRRDARRTWWLNNRTIPGFWFGKKKKKNPKIFLMQGLRGFWHIMWLR